MGSATPTPHLRADRIVGGDGPDVGGPSLSPRKQARWEAVHRLYDQGLSITAIAEQVHCDRATVRKDLAADHPRRPAVPARTPVTRDDQLLRELWDERLGKPDKIGNLARFRRTTPGSQGRFTAPMRH